MNAHNNHNAFLKDFLEMRKQTSPASKSPADVLPKKDTKKKTQLKEEPKSITQTNQPSLQSIIEEKPHRKVLIEFLQNKANEYTLQKMK